MGDCEDGYAFRQRPASDLQNGRLQLEHEQPDRAVVQRKVGWHGFDLQGRPGITSVSVKKIDNNTIEETDKRDGKPITVLRINVGHDGKIMSVKVDDKLHGTSSQFTASKQ